MPRSRPHRLPPPGRTGTLRALLIWFAAGFVVPLIIGIGRAATARAPDAATSRRPGGVAVLGRSREFERTIAAAFSHFSGGRENEAFEEFALACRLAPDDPRPHLGLAEVYRKLGLLAEAEVSFRKAIDLDGTCWPAKLALAGLLRDRGLHDEAMAFLRGLEREGVGSFIQGEIGVSILRRGSPRDALPYLERYAAAGDKGKNLALAYLGRALADLGERERALECFRRSLEIDPAFPLARLWLGDLLLRMGRKEEGERQLQVFQRIRVLVTQAQVLESRLNRSPDSIEALAGLARIRLLLRKHEEALALLDRALELAPGDGDLARLREAVVGSMGAAGPR